MVTPSFRHCALPLALAFGALLAGCSGGSPRASSAALLPQDANITQSAPQQMSKPFDPVYRTVVLNTHPIAYFPFDRASEGSLVNGYTTTLSGGAKIAPGGPIKDEPKDRSLSLAGMAYASTSLSGGIPGTGSMVAWVNLSELPSVTNTYFYVCGESQGGNDFDLQFQNDNLLYFFTGGGENTSYAPNVATLVGQWNMIAVTYQGGPSGFRNIYWNGQLVAPANGNVDSAPKTAQFSVGESLLFTGRYFQGSIDDVAVWNRALTTQEVGRIFRASK